MPDLSYSYGSYYNILRELHVVLQPTTYVEVGIRRGDSLRFASRCQRAVGIDPAPILTDVPGRNTTVFEMTSDDFFETHDLRAELGDRDVDLAFVDGMHLFENALADLANLESYCTGASIVAIHDCTPPNERSAARDRETDIWVGDVWKLTPCLAKYRPELTMSIIDAGPSGLLLLSGLGSGNSALTESRDEILDEYVPMEWDSYLANVDVAKGITRSFPDALAAHGIA